MLPAEFAGFPAYRPPPAAPLPVLYQVLLTRSLFAREARSASATMAAQVVAGGGNGEATMVFRGVGVSDNKRSAYIEDMTSRRITRHHEGESIGGGRITSLNLDEMVCLAGGQTKHILPGQNLLGQAVAPPPPPASQPAQPNQPGGPPGGPGRQGRPQLPPGMTPEQAAAMQAAAMQAMQEAAVDSQPPQAPQ